MDAQKLTVSLNVSISLESKQSEAGRALPREGQEFSVVDSIRSSRGLSAGSATTTELNNPIAHWYHLCYDSTSIALYISCLQVPCRHKDHIPANY